MKKYRSLILNRLLDKYESSKSFIDANTVRKSFRIELSKIFPEYADDSNVKEIQQINEAVSELESEKIVFGIYKRNGLMNAVKLNTDRLEDCYRELKRIPKKDINDELLTLLNQYQNGNDIVNRFASVQIERIRCNKKAEHFKGSVNDYADLLKTLSEITKVEQETFMRDFSIRVLGDSKAFEKIKSTVISVLDQYGDFPDRDTILQDLNILRNPGHVYFKGSGMIQIKGQTIDLNTLKGDIAISSSLLSDVEIITVTGKTVVTIENLTTFNSYRPDNEFVIYLGGYHNTLRREFIKLLYKQNPEVRYCHYGDIDAGGFSILLDLRKKTGVHFEPLHMDVETLSENLHFTKTLTENDIKRLKNFVGSEFKDVIAYMLRNNCKLEQEALD